MNAARLIACALAAAGCYRPGPENNCTIRCTPAAGCADGLTCDNNRCRDPMLAPCGDEPMFDAGVDPDAYLDAPIDASLLPDAPFVDAAMNNCWGRDLITYCRSTPPTTDMPFPAGTEIDTDGSMCAVDSPPNACVIMHQRITITGPITAVGSRVLVMIATNELTIAAPASIDVSSALSRNGAGSHTGVCQPGTAGKASGATVSGGGAGGTLSGRGGFGGTSGGVGGMGGIPGAPATTVVTEPRGGCPGTDGGGLAAGTGGRGGGGVVLIAGAGMIIQGSVLAHGAAGRGGSPGKGGGGGGSGGLIALDGATIMLTGTLVAAGGGGGGGGGLGENGEPGRSSNVMGDQAGGGAGGGGIGGNGGEGSGPGMLRNGGPGAAVPSGGGGGGGGGGAAGIIRIYGSVLVPNTATIVPPAS